MVSSPTAKHHPIDPAADVGVPQHGRWSTHAPTHNDRHGVINVDLLEFEDTVQEMSLSCGTCKGYTLNLPVGTSAYSSYPFTLHDTLVLPWDFKVKNGLMALLA